MLFMFVRIVILMIKGFLRLLEFQHHPEVLRLPVAVVLLRVAVLLQAAAEVHRAVEVRAAVGNESRRHKKKRFSF